MHRRLKIRMSNGSLETITLDDRDCVTYSPWHWAAWMPWDDVRQTVIEQGHFVESEEVID